MIRALASLFRRPAQPSPLRLAQIEREAAAVAYVKAQARNDSRDKHWAHKRFQRATLEVLHQERLAGVR